MKDSSLQELCRKLPKVELHAHLNTSYSLTSLQELVSLGGDTWEHAKEELQITSDEDIDKSFVLFTKIQKLVRTEEAVYLLTHRVITEMAHDNVKYLELRSTPKEIPETGLTRELYMRTMLRAVKDCEDEGLDIVVRLLVSIDRRHGVEVGQITVDLAHKLMLETNGVVLGIDFSGDPKVGHGADFIPVFLDAHSKGLKMAIHLAELPLFDETKQVLKACAGVCDMRIGHGTYLHRYEQGQGHDEMEDLVIKHKVPLEVCMTSNLKTSTVDCYEHHHFQYWRSKGHPVTINTDGKGVYACTLSDEYYTAAKTFNLSLNDLKDCSMSSVEQAFADKDTKDKLKAHFRQILSSL